MRIGILGGGQLARMLVESSNKYNITFKVLAKEDDSPAGKIVREIIVGDWNDEKCLRSFVDDCDVITLENEFIDHTKLEFIEKLGKKVFPSSNVIRLIQDKLIQKQTIKEAGIPIADFEAVNSEKDIEIFAGKFGYPVILKSRTMGYDGKGNYKINSANEIKNAFAPLRERGELMCERFIEFDKEIAVQASRNVSGEVMIYPVVETVQKDHICHLVKASKSGSGLNEKVEDICRKLLAKLDYVGVLAIEMFLVGDEILVNELAPRVHNSGHYTIEGCFTSQFENHIRAVLDLPAGSAEMVTPNAVMINILGERNGAAKVEGLEAILKLDKVYFHDYGKNDTKVGRKMGHITVLDESLDQAVKVAEECRKNIII